MSALPRLFLLRREEDVTGVSGTGDVASGIWWPDEDVVALRWHSEWPTSVVFHERGMESVEAIHGHNGRTLIVFLDSDLSTFTVNGKPKTWREMYEAEREQNQDYSRWRTMVSDLDRNENGRHEGDADSGDPSGTSQGNPLMPTGTTIGWTIYGQPYVVPEPRERGRIEAWLDGRQP